MVSTLIHSQACAERECVCVSMADYPPRLENRELPARAATQDIHQCKYRLAREVIYQHLKIQVQARFPDLLVRRFTSVAAREFKEYVQTYSVYFVMCHNGVLQGKEELLDETLLMICNMMALGLDVAVMNEIEWRDSKVCVLFFN